MSLGNYRDDDALLGLDSTEEQPQCSETAHTLGGGTEQERKMARTTGAVLHGDLQERMRRLEEKEKLRAQERLRRLRRTEERAQETLQQAVDERETRQLALPSLAKGICEATPSLSSSRPSPAASATSTLRRLSPEQPKVPPEGAKSSAAVAARGPTAAAATLRRQQVKRTTFVYSQGGFHLIGLLWLLAAPPSLYFLFLVMLSLFLSRSLLSLTPRPSPPSSLPFLDVSCVFCPVYR